MRIVLDAMGGEHAPAAHVEAAQQAIKAFADLEITLVGNSDEINKYLNNDHKITILHTMEKN